MSDFLLKVWKEGEPINLSHYQKDYLCELRPDEAHIKPDGANDNSPSLCLVLRNSIGKIYTAQISARMFMPTMKKLMEIANEKASK